MFANRLIEKHNSRLYSIFASNVVLRTKIETLYRAITIWRSIGPEWISTVLISVYHRCVFDFACIAWIIGRRPIIKAIENGWRLFILGENKYPSDVF